MNGRAIQRIAAMLEGLTEDERVALLAQLAPRRAEPARSELTVEPLPPVRVRPVITAEIEWV